MRVGRHHSIVHVRPFLVVVLAIFGSFAASAALLPVRGHVENTNIALGLVVVVLVVALLGGRRAGLASAIATAVAFDFFFTRPFTSLRITTSADVQTTALLAAIGVVSGEVVEWARRSGVRAEAARASLDAVYQRAELAAGADSAGRLIRLAMEELTRLLDLKSCRYVRGPAPRSMPELAHASILVPADVDPAVRGQVALSVRAHGRVQGHVVMAFPAKATGIELSSEQRHAAVAIADQLGVGLLRFHEP